MRQVHVCYYLLVKFFEKAMKYIDYTLIARNK